MKEIGRLNLTGDALKVFVGIDMSKDKFDYCAIDSGQNILLTGRNCANMTEQFQKFTEVLDKLNSLQARLFIGMESAGIYHIPLCNHLEGGGYRVRILNGLEVRGTKSSGANSSKRGKEKRRGELETCKRREGG